MKKKSIKFPVDFNFRSKKMQHVPVEIQFKSIMEAIKNDPKDWYGN